MQTCPSCRHEFQKPPEDIRDWFRCDQCGIPLRLASAFSKSLYWVSILVVLLVGIIPLFLSLGDIFEGADYQFYLLGGCILAVYGGLARLFWKTKLSRPRLYDPYSSLNLSDAQKKFRRPSRVRLQCAALCLWGISGYQPAKALPSPHIAWPILVVIALEYMVWPFLTQFVSDVPRCPICKSFFQWSEIDAYDKRGQRQPRPLSFPCPKCAQTIGVPSWRKSFLSISYLTLIAFFMFLIFELPGDLFLGYVGTLVVAIGAVRIADWFIWRRLEPGSPNPFTPFM